MYANTYTGEVQATMWVRWRTLVLWWTTSTHTRARTHTLAHTLHPHTHTRTRLTHILDNQFGGNAAEFGELVCELNFASSA